MEYLSEWVFNIIIFLIIAMVVDMLLPESSMKKYTKLATGLLLMAIVLTPVLKLISSDFEKVLASFTTNIDVEDQTNENLLKTKKKEIQASQHAYILEQMAVQMKKMVEKELVDKYSAEISNLRISATPNSDGTINELDNVVVSLTPSEKVIKTIQPVNINFQETDAKMDTTDYETMKSMLANTWEIPISLIEIVSREEPGNEE
ncbi:stage III sporulation protein AF [Lederbergia wuyishanensis]|uniref:Stage III sporulation protein AF n=1 Tax=Lederbergia wuyishanensis TaxID=1347903 RepID=A0ABU0D1C0_9BACI|nr:stage III sporulation protein AF [Lederbergia wuyishanensis]MCJ8006795.1 stage III sporulation protein AF [Lederbergia wuyishanensis]MDQ0342177.1 stage III sporulation protein AF [Lederbergia wuyishanensis]